MSTEVQQEWKLNLLLVLFVTRILATTKKMPVKYIYWFYYWNASRLLQPWNIQEWCWGVKADKIGKVITHGEYIEQQSKAKSDRTPFQVKGENYPESNKDLTKEDGENGLIRAKGVAK